MMLDSWDTLIIRVHVVGVVNVIPFPVCRVQCWFVALSTRLCEVLSSRFHTRTAAPQPLSGELGGAILSASVSGLPPCMSDVLWA